MKAASVKSVAIIGAGPVGLAAAAHALERGLEPTVLEAGPRAGHAMRQWGHVQLFSPWEFNVDKASARLARSSGMELARARPPTRPGPSWSRATWSRSRPGPS